MALSSTGSTESLGETYSVVKGCINGHVTIALGSPLSWHNTTNDSLRRVLRGSETRKRVELGCWRGTTDNLSNEGACICPPGKPH